MTHNEQQVTALAGLFQAMQAIDDVATTGTCNNELAKTALNSLFITSPDSTICVFGKRENLETGLKQISKLLGTHGSNKNLHTVRYALAVIQLERKISQQPDLLNALSKQLERADTQVQHFGLEHENIYASLADIYTKTVSTFKLRIQISGQERFLTIDHNAAKIRTLLLAGIRAAMLWRQLNGHRWHFVFKRKALSQASESILSSLNNSPLDDQ